MIRRLVSLAAIAIATCVGTVQPIAAQAPSTLTRATAPEITDSTLFLVSIANPFRTRAVTLGILRSAFGGGGADSVMLKNGTAAAPSLKFTNSTGLGLYRYGADTIGIATGGAHSLRISGGAAVKIVGGAGAMTIQAGTGNNRALVLQGTNGSGTATTGLQVSQIAGVEAVSVTQLSLPNGSTTTPGIMWNTAGSAQSGFYFSTDGGSTVDSIHASIQGARALTISGGAAVALTGGAGNMTILCGTGNSRTCTFQTTTSAGTPKNTLVLGADTTVTALGNFRSFPLGNAGCNGSDSVGMALKSSRLRNTGICFNLNGTDTSINLVSNNTRMLEIVKGTGNDYIQVLSASLRANVGSASTPSLASANDANTGLYWLSSGSGDTLAIATGGAHSLGIRGGASPTLFGGAGNMTIQAGTGNSRTMTLQSTTSAGTATTFLVGSGDTAKFAGHIIATGLTTEPSTQSALCVANGGGEVYINAAATCTVSSARFKDNIAPLSLADATRITFGLRPVTFDYKADRSHAIGLVAEQADSVDRRLATRDPEGRVNSVNYEQVTIALLKVVQDQQRQLDSLKTALRRKP